MEAVFSIFQSFFSNAEYLVPTIWVTLGCSVAWFLLSAKRDKEITKKEARMLWKSHKQFNHCSANTFKEINKGRKIIGYLCQCGHQHRQQSPMINIRH
jgi:hypothetical protein